MTLIVAGALVIATAAFAQTPDIDTPGRSSCCNSVVKSQL